MQTDRERGTSDRSPSNKHAEPFPIPNRLPVFPLPNVVFFPKTYLPLHIFEPRYRRMVADVTMGGQCIAMALLKDGWEPDYYGNPAIYPALCIGRIVSVQPLPDGCSNILLQGLERSTDGPPGPSFAGGRTGLRRAGVESSAFRRYLFVRQL